MFPFETSMFFVVNAYYTVADIGIRPLLVTKSAMEAITLAFMTCTVGEGGSVRVDVLKEGKIYSIQSSTFILLRTYRNGIWEELWGDPTLEKQYQEHDVESTRHYIHTVERLQV